MSNDVTTDPALDEFLGAKPAKPWRKWAIRGGVGVALLIAILLVSQCFSGDDKPNYATREVRKGDLTVAVSATGNLKPVNQVDVSRAQLSSAQTNLSIAQIVSPVTGVVLSRDIEPGQTVAASFNAPVLFTIAEDLTQMEVEVSVDEADVGQVKDGQSATFAVDAFPGRTFPATVSRVNVGSNASSTSSSSTTTTSTTGTVVAYTAVLTVNNEDETLRPGMTATADIVTQELRDVLLIPNSALRFKPSAGAKGGGITSVLPGPGRMRRGGNARQVNFGAGSSQTVYVLDEDGNPKAVQVTIGASDGSRTAITGGEIKEGMRVITGQLAAGQEAPAEDQRPAATDAKAPDRQRNPATDGKPASVGSLGNSGDKAPETAPVVPTETRGTGRPSGT